MNPILLGGWRDVVDDLRRLARALANLPTSCACGHGSAHLAGTCGCCAGERRLDDACTDCERLLNVIQEEMDDLVDRTLRFLPALEHAPATEARPQQPWTVAHLRGQILRAAEIFQHVESASGEFRRGCGASHLATMKTLANQLVIEADQVDWMLRGILPRRGAGDGLGLGT